MGAITFKSSISGDIPTSGRNMLDDLTYDFVWDENVLRYHYGGIGAVDYDPVFRDIYDSGPVFFYADGSQPDANYRYEILTERAFEMIDSVIAVDFQEITSSFSARTQADLIMVSADETDEPIEGFFMFPGDARRSFNDFWSLGTITSSYSYLNVTAETGGGSYISSVLIHEIGHGLGLLHPFDSSGTLPSVGRLDSQRYTVMSYTEATPYSATTGFADTYGQPVSLMAIDIAALQQQYGTESYATGNSSYRLMDTRGGALRLDEGNVQIARAYYSIWDSGGTDEIYYDGSNSVLINLNAATLDRSGVASDAAPSITAMQNLQMYQSLDSELRTETIDPDYHAGGFFSRVMTRSGGVYEGIDGGYSIANGALIEDAVGGNDADMLIGNELANILHGNGGDDGLVGGRGADLLEGGSGVDAAGYSGVQSNYQVTFNFDGSVQVAHTSGSRADGTDTLIDVELLQFSNGGRDLRVQQNLTGNNGDEEIIGQMADDTLSGQGGNDTIGGGGGNDSINAGDGNDLVHGGSGNDTIIGGGGNDEITGGSATNDLRDNIFGGLGNDTIDGGAGNDELRGDAGNDEIAGGAGVDTVIGGTGDDVMTGSAFSDLVFGGDGDDFVNGGFGSDRVNGGDGADRFYHVGVAGHGSDWVQDFESAEGDRLVYGGAASAANFQINYANTANAGDAEDEAFIVYRPTGQILWALVDGGAQDSIFIRIDGVDYDLVA